MLRQILHDEWRFLSFRNTSSGPARHWQAYLAFGLICTWLAGIGRYWDNPRALWWQSLGLGSLAYVGALALLLWLLIWPLKPRHWSLRNVLVFVTLTAPPALLYAIPVERFLSMAAAQDTNAWFLALVASWRVALLAVFLRRVAQLSWAALVVATLTPLALIVFSLSMLNLEHVVFRLMAGIGAEEKSANDAAYVIVLVLTYFSFLASPALLIAYAFETWKAWHRRP